MNVRSYAKINLILEIISKRNDGYHELRSLMQTISLFDEISLHRTDSEGIQLSCNNSLVGMGRENLVYCAAEKFFAKIGSSGGILIDLKKKIPVGAGLGGGSSNAASTLKCLNILWGKPMNREQLMELAAELGSDVPFFIDGGTSLATGRGERIVRLPFIGKRSVLLINSGVFVSTAAVYSNFKLDLTSPYRLPNILPVLTTGGISDNELFPAINNDLQSTVLELFPEIHGLMEWMICQGADSACVSGSGGTVFGLFKDAQKASDIALRAQKEFHWACLTSTIE